MLLSIRQPVSVTHHACNVWVFTLFRNGHCFYAIGSRLLAVWLRYVDETGTDLC
jgi:hypothetical protein